jgi:iron complex outermembrane receptor protein
MHADLTDTVRLSASYQYSNNRQFGTNFQLTGDLPAPLGEGDVDFTSSQFTTRTDTGDTEHRMHAHVGQAKLEVDVGDNLLTLQTSRITYGLNFLDDFDYSNQDTINFYRTEDYRQTAQEVRFQSPTGGTVEYMVGGFFMDSRWNALDDQEWLVPGIPSPVDIPGLGSLLFNGSYATQYDQKAKTYSGFASGSIKLGDAVRINGGVRYTRETKDGVMSRTSRAPYTFWNMAAVPPFGPTPLAHNANFFDGNISLQYNVARDMMVYASFGHGSKSGGYVETNTIAVAGRPVTADDVKAGAFIGDEYTKSYEVGLKSMLFDRKVRFNILGYYTDVKGFQDTVFTGGPLGFITSNGPARSKGFEIETAVKITSELEFNGSLSYVDATMVIQPIDATTLLPKVDGNGDPVLQRFRRSQAPKISFNAGVNYDRSLTEALDLHLGAGLQHRNRMYNLRQNLFPSDALTTVDLSAGIRASDHKWSLDVVAKNVGNSTSEEFGLPSPDPRYGAAFGSYVAAISPARTILITAGFKF